MSDVKLIYFDGCPNANKVKEILEEMRIAYTAIDQSKLNRADKYKAYTSPSVLMGEKVIIGSKTDGSGGCSLDLSELDKLAERLINQPKKKAAFFSTIGSFGSALIIGLCPVCIPAIGAFLSAIGLGFVVSEAFLFPLLIVFLAITIGGLFWSFLREHHVIWPLVGGVLMGFALYFGRYVYFNSLLNNFLMYGGIIGIVAVNLWNLRLRKKVDCQSCVIE